ncbi:MAG: AIR synthase-related protein, partial [Clostridia bacterium]|nr:AIR synthase-related protein [Clostridia bacterium]
NPQELCLIDSFIWPFPDEEALGALDLAIDACVDFVKATGMPFISGKDSLSSTYRGTNEIIKIPPVLCVSVFGRLPDLKKTVSSDLKSAGNLLWLVGSRKPEELGGSVFYRLQNLTRTNLPQINLEHFMQTCQELHKAIQSGQVKACHDLSEGGWSAAAAEMASGCELGLKLQIQALEKPEEFLFNETAGCFLVETSPEIDLSRQFSFCRLIGSVQEKTEIIVQQQGQILVQASLADLKQAWQKPLKEVFG